MGGHPPESFESDSGIIPLDDRGGFVELPEAGASVNAGDVIGTIEAVKTVADLFAPVSGTVSEVNKDIEDQPDVVNSSPYDGGWFMKIKMSDGAELEQLMSHDAYQQMIGEA